MQNIDKSTVDLPEIIFSSADDLALAKRISRLAKAGKIRPIRSGIYTSNLESPIESITIRHWKVIAEHLFPGAVIGYKSSLRGGPVAGQVFLVTGDRARRIELPGVEFVIIPGSPAIMEGPIPDVPYGKLYVSSEPRKLLENLSTAKGSSERSVGRLAVEAELEKILTIRGEGRLNTLREAAKEIAVNAGLINEYAVLNQIIGALLCTHDSKILQTKSAKARMAGVPYDTDRMPRFDALFGALNSQVFNHEAIDSSGYALENFAFFESYFSNFIEGTEFTYEEAEDIVFNGQMIDHRMADSHDVKGTFDAIISAKWRTFVPGTPELFMQGIQKINAMVMQSRPEKHPGEWKTQFNQAGSTVFVAPPLVKGTLKEGFDRMHALTDPMARALMTMFVISETHPFSDGNGRTARIAMNACLSRYNLSRIIIPTIYREDYLLPLKALSNHNDPEAFIRSMSAAHHWSAAVNWHDPRARIRETLENCNAFKEDIRSFKLMAPEYAKSFKPK